MLNLKRVHTHIYQNECIPQVKIITVNPDVEVGIKQLNDILKDMAMNQRYQIHDVKPMGNTYFITYQKTIDSDEVQNEKDISERVIPDTEIN